MTDNFKLTLADFIEVPEADRVKGKEYWVADEDNVKDFKAGKPYATTTWSICRRLNGEIITPNPTK